MKKATLLFFACVTLLVLFTRCDFDNPQFQGISNIKVAHLNTKELVFSADAKIYNPNNYKVSIRPSTLDLYLDDVYIGKAKLLEKYKMKKESTTTATMPISIQLNSGVYAKLIGLTFGKTVVLHLKGPLKVGVAGLGFRKNIDEEKKINLKKLGLDLKKLFKIGQ